MRPILNAFDSLLRLVLQFDAMRHLHLPVELDYLLCTHLILLQSFGSWNIDFCSRVRSFLL